jgi:hypothetical protein
MPIKKVNNTIQLDITKQSLYLFIIKKTINPKSTEIKIINKIIRIARSGMNTNKFKKNMKMNIGHEIVLRAVRKLESFNLKIRVEYIKENDPISNEINVKSNAKNKI